MWDDAQGFLSVVDKWTYLNINIKHKYHVQCFIEAISHLYGNINLQDAVVLTQHLDQMKKF